MSYHLPFLKFKMYMLLVSFVMGWKRGRDMVKFESPVKVHVSTKIL